MLRRMLEVVLVQVGQDMPDKAGSTYTHILNYMEVILVVTLCRDNLQRRVRYRLDATFPRAVDDSRLVQNLQNLQKEDRNMQVRFQAVRRCRSLANIWGTFLEWLDEYSEHGGVTGICWDGNAPSNSFGLPLFQINGRTHNGRVGIFCVGYIQAENRNSVTLMLLEFKNSTKSPVRR